MSKKKPRIKLEQFKRLQQEVIRAQFRNFAKRYIERLSDLEAIGLSSPSVIWSIGPKVYGLDSELEVSFRDTELDRVRNRITDWAYTAEGAATMKQRIQQAETYRSTGNPADGGFSDSGLYLEQLRRADLSNVRRIRAQLEEHVMEARFSDMQGYGFGSKAGIYNADVLQQNRVDVCTLVEEHCPGYKLEPKGEGVISFRKPLCEDWLIRIRIVEGDLLRSIPVRQPSGRLSIATLKMGLQAVDLKQNKFIGFSLEDLVPIKNSLFSDVFSRIYDSLDQLLFAVQASIASYSTVENEFESCVLEGIKQLSQFENT